MGSPGLRFGRFHVHVGDRAARVGYYKWVDSAAGSGLFDLSRDPGEEHDLSSEQPKMLAHLQGRFSAWAKAMEPAEQRGPFRDYDVAP